MGDSRARQGLVVVGDGSVIFDAETPKAVVTLCSRARKPADVETHVVSKGTATTQVAVDPGAFVLAAGGCAELTISLNGVSVDEVEPGVVVFVSTRGVVQVAYTAAEDSAVAAAFAEALGPTEFQITRDWMRRDGAKSDSNLLAVRYDATPGAIPSQTVVMSDGERVLKVDASTKFRNDGVVRFALGLHQDDPDVPPVDPDPGNYKGTLVFGKDKTVPFTVEVDDSFLWFGILLAISVCSGAVLKYVTDRIASPRGWNVSYLKNLYGAQAPAGVASYLPPDADAIKEWRDANKEAQDAYFDTVVVPSASDPGLVKVVEEIAAAQTDASVFHTEFPKSLANLKAVADVVGSWRQVVYPGSPSPTLWTADDGIQAVLGEPENPGSPARPPEHLGVGQATKLKARADALTELAKQWRREAEQVIRMAQWLKVVRANPDPSEPAAQDHVADASLHLAEAWARLSAATEADTIGAAVGDDVRQAFSRLTRAAGPDTPAPRVESEVADSSDAFPEPPEDEQREFARDGSFIPPLADYLIVWAGRYLPSAASLKRWLIDLGPLMLTTLIAYFTFLGVTKVAIYDDLPFATWESVLATVVAGLAATSVIDALFKAIGWVRGGLAAVLAK